MTNYKSMTKHKKMNRLEKIEVAAIEVQKAIAYARSTEYMGDIIDNAYNSLNEALKPEFDWKNVPIGSVVIMNKKIAEDFTEIVASNLHYNDNSKSIDLNKCTAEEIINLSNGWVNRYHSDSSFRSQVMSIVSALIQNLDKNTSYRRM